MVSAGAFDCAGACDRGGQYGDRGSCRPCLAPLPSACKDCKGCRGRDGVAGCDCLSGGRFNHLSAVYAAACSRLVRSVKVLILSPYPPYPPHGGGTMRIYQLIRGLAMRHDVTCLTFVP